MYRFQYRYIVLYRQKNIAFFLYIVISFIYHDIFDILLYFTPKSLYFYYCVTKITRINGENNKLTEAN